LRHTGSLNGTLMARAAPLPTSPDAFCLVELTGLEPVTPCLQIVFSCCWNAADLVLTPPQMYRPRPLLTVANDAPMFVKLFAGFCY
jgi:hypothetical protein